MFDSGASSVSNSVTGMLGERLSEVPLMHDERNRQVFSMLATRLIGGSQFEPASFIYEMLRAADPQHGYYNRALGICYERIDRLDDAREALERAILADLGDALALVSLAAIELREGDKAGARQNLQAAQSANGNDDPKLAKRITLMLKGASAA